LIGRESSCSDWAEIMKKSSPSQKIAKIFSEHLQDEIKNSGWEGMGKRLPDDRLSLKSCCFDGGKIKIVITKSIFSKPDQDFVLCLSPESWEKKEKENVA